MEASNGHLRATHLFPHELLHLPSPPAVHRKESRRSRAWASARERLALSPPHELLHLLPHLRLRIKGIEKWACVGELVGFGASGGRRGWDRDGLNAFASALLETDYFALRTELLWRGKAPACLSFFPSLVGLSLRATPVGAFIWTSTPNFRGLVQKHNSSRTSKQSSIFEAPPNSPSHPPFPEALHFPLQMWAPPFFPFPPPSPTQTNPQT
jgi:hypothetical protein